MTKLIRLSKSNIEYLTHGWGVFSGCRNQEAKICPVPNCWARGITERFKSHYPDGFNPHVYPEALLSPLGLKKPARIGVGWVGDLIGYADPDMDVPVDYLASKPGVATANFRDALLGIIRQCPQHQFFFLTKNPERLPLWGKFPPNCFVGVSVWNQESYDKAISYLKTMDAKNKWLSIEPLLGAIDLSSYIGYNDNNPIKEGANNEAYNVRGDSLSSGCPGGTRDRRTGLYLANQKQDRNTLGEGGDTDSMPEETSRTRYGNISSSESNGRLEADVLHGTSTCMETFSRLNPTRDGNQPEKREEKRQSSGESRSSDLFREHSPCSPYPEGGANRPERDKECDVQTQRGSNQGDTVFERGNTEGYGNKTRSPDTGTSGQVRCKLPHSVGCHPGESVEISFIVIGAQSRPTVLPNRLWVDEIAAACQRAKIPYWLKNNLVNGFHKQGLSIPRRQELPQ